MGDRATEKFRSLVWRATEVASLMGTEGFPRPTRV
jgi:hypothetical protein